MEFRPCIDIHNGSVKQIVGDSLKDAGSEAEENFVSKKDASFYARLYRENDIKGGHVIMLNPVDSQYYEATKAQALKALAAFPQGLQIGGGITPDNADKFLAAGASHVIVTSYVFRNGKIYYDNLKQMMDAVGKDRLVLDLSCRRTEKGYFIVTDRWQKPTQEKVDTALLDRLADCCDEFLIHAVDVEGRADGIEKPLAGMLGSWGKRPVTYAGGIHSYEDLDLIRRLGKGHLNVTVGSALDMFGGKLEWRKVLEICTKKYSSFG